MSSITSSGKKIPFWSTLQESIKLKSASTGKFRLRLPCYSTEILWHNYKEHPIIDPQESKLEELFWAKFFFCQANRSYRFEWVSIFMDRPLFNWGRCEWYCVHSNIIVWRDVRKTGEPIHELKGRYEGNW